MTLISKFVDLVLTPLTSDSCYLKTLSFKAKVALTFVTAVITAYLDVSYLLAVMTFFTTLSATLKCLRRYLTSLIAATPFNFIYLMLSSGIQLMVLSTVDLKQTLTIVLRIYVLVGLTTLFIYTTPPAKVIEEFNSSFLRNAFLSLIIALNVFKIALINFREAYHIINLNYVGLKRYRRYSLLLKLVVLHTVSKALTYLELLSQKLSRVRIGGLTYE